MTSSKNDIATSRPLLAGRGFACDTLVLAVFVALVDRLDHAPGLLAVLLTVGGILRLRSSCQKSQTLTYAVAAIAGVGFDSIRVALGTYEYLGYALFPPFMPLLWGQIGLMVNSLLTWIDERSATKWTRPPGPVERAATGAVLLGSVFGLPLVDDHAGWAVAIFLGSFGVFSAVVRRPGDLELGLIAALLGPLVEFALVSTGLYRFDSGRVWGLPLWLPAVWPLYAIVLRRARGCVEWRSSRRS